MFATLIETGKVPTEELFDQPVIAGHDPVDWLCGQLWTAPIFALSTGRELDNAADTYGHAVRLIHTRRLH